MRNIWISVLVFMAGPAIRVPARAASFNCASAKSAREKLICQDPDLSAKDSEVGTLYQQRRALLSPEGATLLQQSQRSWLHFIGIVCPTEISASLEQERQHARYFDQRRLPKGCLTEQYKERLIQLSGAATKIGPFLFNRVDLYVAQAAPDQYGSAEGFFIRHIAYPQIDAPATEPEKLWNKQTIVELPANAGCDGPEGDFDAGYEIGFASRSLVSLRSTYWTYCHGTPHGYGGSTVVNTLLRTPLRELSESDVFGAGDDWKEKVQALFWDALLKNGWKPPTNMGSGPKDDIDDYVISAKNWKLTAEGIEVSFGSYMGGCYACNPGQVTVPWSSLRPLLNHNFSVP